MSAEKASADDERGFAVTSVLLTVSLGLSIAVGLWTLTLSIRGPSPSWQAAMGVLFIVVGFHGFTSLRVARLEKMIQELKEHSARR
jgi:XapX domain-containing protein